jgi:hypothetical protein
MENKKDVDPWRLHATEAGDFATGPHAQGHARPARLAWEATVWPTCLTRPKGWRTRPCVKAVVS